MNIMGNDIHGQLVQYHYGVELCSTS